MNKKQNYLFSTLPIAVIVSAADNDEENVCLPFGQNRERHPMSHMLSRRNVDDVPD